MAGCDSGLRVKNKVKAACQPGRFTMRRPYADRENDRLYQKSLQMPLLDNGLSVIAGVS